ncbi:hypothetical protein [Mycolicibacterium fluoranthenivorans]|uniref:Uncharacterized protein n=1 Tax=Mycolicibacterium fluoranthenivorans TaxID=258505 RepID=A0A1G4WMN2_9MYCO|nr:hypothetical protein [Mycolicibacterium fluoranthenivorans]SCX25353.1 hypothetical protein SAMN02799620_03825 [Mycolicibacterium fluoranthenivorans]
MTITDPQPALAEQSSFIGYLVGLAGLGRLVRSLAAPGSAGPYPGPHPEDDFVHLLLGLASIGTAIEGLVGSEPDLPPVSGATSLPSSGRWLR